MNRAQLNGMRGMSRDLNGRKLARIDRVINNGLWSFVEREASFSWSGCERCNILSSERLGASVYTVEGYETLEESRKDGESGRDDHAHSFNLCGECIYTLTFTL
jgi:hypothetical protein